MTNKTISSRFNKLGADDIYVKEFLPNGTDITAALDAAINFLAGSSSGGRILIPRGNWSTNGNHEFASSISIEGYGVTSNGTVPVIGTSINLDTRNGGGYVFRISANKQNCSLKNLTINLVNSFRIGLLITNNPNGVIGDNIYLTSLENVQFRFGEYGIKVDSQGTTDLECILNRFEKVTFIQCQTAFYCNSINGGYSFDTCYFQIPIAGTALNCISIGNMALENCLFGGVSTIISNEPPSDNSTILKTSVNFNCISFNNCQDENVQYYYKNDSFGWQVPIVFRSCVIQSSFQFKSYGEVIFDSCRINVTQTNGKPPITVISDWWQPAPNNPPIVGAAIVYLKGATDLFVNIGTNTNLVNFLSPFSAVRYESNESGLPVIKPLSEAPPVPPNYYSINETRGAVNIEAGTSSIKVLNNRVTPDTLIFTQLRTFDSGGAMIREVICSAGFYDIYLTRTATTRLSIGFKVEGANF